uniref:hypothetical protein n=1 Tax=Klebsiella pneumoniae TaxID=573 RepID=UPI00286D990F
LKMPAFEWVHVQLHQQKGMISLSPPTICNSAESLAEANAMLSAVSEDARKASNTEDKRDLESLQGWLEENINSQLAGVK